MKDGFYDFNFKYASGGFDKPIGVFIPLVLTFASYGNRKVGIVLFRCVGYNGSDDVIIGKMSGIHEFICAN